MRLSLTKHAEYALRILVWLAQDEACRPACGRAAGDSPAQPVRRKAAEIAAAAGVPPVFAMRILAQLQRCKLLTARAGQQGGYSLARRPDDLSLLEIIESVEGPLGSDSCVMREMACGADGYCVLHNAWSTAQSSLRNVLASTSLASAVSG